jgi:hypothetical protein
MTATQAILRIAVLMFVSRCLVRRSGWHLSSSGVLSEGRKRLLELRKMISGQESGKNLEK